MKTTNIITLRLRILFSFQTLFMGIMVHQPMYILHLHFLQVSYVKAIDWYLICCFLFVFGVLVEYTIVLYLDNIGQRKRKKKELQKKLEIEERKKVHTTAFCLNSLLRKDST